MKPLRESSLEERAMLEIRGRMLEKYPVPQGTPGAQHEDAMRAWCLRFAEQAAFERPYDGWGLKRADPHRPLGKDTIARKIGEQLYAWDLFTATGTGRPEVTLNPEPMDISGQVFVPVEPRNHLDVAPPLANPDALIEALQEWEKELAQIRRDVARLLAESRLVTPYPVYRGKLAGFSVTFTPDPPVRMPLDRADAARLAAYRPAPADDPEMSRGRKERE